VQRNHQCVGEEDRDWCLQDPGSLYTNCENVRQLCQGGEGNTGWAWQFSLSQPNLIADSFLKPSTAPFISLHPMFHLPYVTIPWHPCQPIPFPSRPYNSGSEAPGIFQSAIVLLAHCSWKQQPESGEDRMGPGWPVMVSLFPLLLISPFLEQSLFPNTPPLPGFPLTHAQQAREA
jgi:hypothetical protein